MFATCSYREFQPWMGIPVRTSLGKPKFRLGFELRHSLPPLTPQRGTLHLPYDDFRRTYRHQLHRHTIGRVLDAAERIRQDEGAGEDVPLVLLCFEDLAQVGAWCHRSFAREWLVEKGQDCMEFGDLLVASPVTLPAAPEPAVAQLDLFAAA
jgi:hypothetical protein